MARYWNPSEIAAPVGKYSHLAEAPAGHRLVWISGQVGIRPDGELAGPDAAAQTRQAFANIEALLDHLGAGPGDLVKLVTLVSGTDPGHLAGFMTGRDEYFAKWYPDGVYPAHTLAVVAGLAKPELAVEIEGIVAVP
ncbi:enamine deaminase RidA [Streptomyces cinnamoneus]|uniref:Enamine deaminase RidA n=1 Tax=Streptomyces cinnamoneus TaxID=53446 RepID=A0A2G1XH82_STRCJ|nr:RidA family protein [Streptomyces cinnamoneus]PHQ50598.1 enamine deaminase RidA [Streptomyces cinnamoneus]PPT14147.1 RidA family protein [Streptomyces cinnamoneus]